MSADQARTDRVATRITRISINPISCDGHGLCAELLPELIELDDWGYPIVTGREVPGDQEPLARRARALCPTLAILLEIDGPGRDSIARPEAENRQRPSIGS